MTRAAAMTAVSALCLLWTAGCASTPAGTSKTDTPASTSADAKAAEVMPDPNADVATLAKTLPGTLDGEIRRAQLLRSKGDYDEAARSLAQLMLIAPDNGLVVGEYGKVLEQQGHSKEALPFLKRATQLLPGEWSIQSALGVAYDQLDDHKSAHAAYERALALKPGEPSVLNNYAVSRMLAGDYAGAKRLLAQAQARGASGPKLEGNLEKLATLAPQSAVAPPAPASAAIPPQPVAAHVQAPPAPVSAKSNAVVAALPQQTTSTHVQLPGSAASIKSNGTVVPAVAHPSVITAIKVSQPSSSARVAVAAPRALGGEVVMQRVPVDPLAGPVHAAAKIAKKPAKPVTVAKKALAETPALRTAADSN